MNTQAILDKAKETILDQGEHAPTIYAEDMHGTLVLFYLTFLPQTTFEKQKLMFALGRNYGQGCTPKRIVTITFVTEAWISKKVVGKKRRYKRPSEDPNRKEALILLSLDCKSGKSTVRQVEMLRDGSGTLVDLLALPDDVQEVHDHMLPYFLAGVASAKMSEEELISIMQKTMRGI